jgi:hypothetical protein
VTPLDFLLHVMRHPDAPPALRLKAASITAPYVHQKRANDGPAKNSITVADKFGMVVDSEVPKKLRDNKFRLLRLSNRRIKHPDEYDRKAPILEARIAAARKQLNCPCPSVYGLKDFSKDHKRLWELSRKRKSRSKLTKAEDTEEVHLTARVEAFAASPEIAARVRMKELQQRQRTAAFAGGHPSV